MSWLRRLGGLLCVVQVLALPAPEQAAAEVESCAMDPARELRLIVDPGFHDFPDARPIDPALHPDHPWMTPEELALEARWFWNGYKLMTAQRRTAGWTTAGRKACIKGHQDGMKWSKKIPPSEAAQWAAGYRSASRPYDPDYYTTLTPAREAGYQAGVTLMTKYSGPEHEMLAYMFCFSGSVEASSLFVDPELREPVSRGLLHGLHVGSCSKGLHDKWKPPRATQPTKQQLGEWFWTCIEERRASCQPKPPVAKDPSQRRQRTSRAKNPPNQLQRIASDPNLVAWRLGKDARAAGDALGQSIAGSNIHFSLPSAPRTASKPFRPPIPL
ncbi:MAG: hypothetical protein M1823_000745 [Watsoniomyces obsoletus]|nr:MAG: hypothetical protein M1823_000745 [Watsoniomyces obsoletus]